MSVPLCARRQLKFVSEVASIRRDLERFAEKVEHMTGYRKEIDHAYQDEEMFI